MFRRRNKKPQKTLHEESDCSHDYSIGGYTVTLGYDNNDKRIATIHIADQALSCMGAGQDRCLALGQIILKKLAETDRRFNGLGTDLNRDTLLIRLPYREREMEEINKAMEALSELQHELPGKETLDQRIKREQKMHKAADAEAREGRATAMAKKEMQPVADIVWHYMQQNKGIALTKQELDALLSAMATAHAEHNKSGKSL